MANVKGKDADFSISDAATEPARPSGSGDAAYADGAADNNRFETYSNEIALNIESNTDEETPFGEDWEQHAIIGGRWSVDITAYLDTATDKAEEIFVKNFQQFLRQRFAFWPGGKPGGEASATQPKYLGRVVIAQATIDPVRTGVARLRARLTGDGELFRAVA